VSSAGFSLDLLNCFAVFSEPARLLISEPASIGHVFGEAQLLRDNFF